MIVLWIALGIFLGMLIVAGLIVWAFARSGDWRKKQ